MKKIIFIILVGLGMGLNVNAFVENFEELDLGAIHGQNNWYGASNIGSSVSSTNAFGEKDLATNAYNSWHYLATSTTGWVQFYFWASASTAVHTVFGIIDDAEKGAYLNHTAGGGNCIIWYGEETEPVSCETWLKIKISFDTDTDLFNLYVDDILIFENQWFNGSSTGLGRLQIGANNETQYYFDNFTSNLDYISGEEPADCSQYNNFQWCIQIAGDWCTWDYASSECVAIDYDTYECGSYGQCQYCETRTECEAETQCEWQRDYTNDFWSIWNDEATSTYGSHCSWVIPPEIPDSTSTQSMGFGLFREVFYNRVPFVYFFETYDMFVSLTNENASETLNEFTISIPDISYGTGTASTTLMESFDIPLFSQAWIYSIIPEETWHTLRSFLAIAVYLGMAFSMGKHIKTLISVHT